MLIIPSLFKSQADALVPQFEIKILASKIFTLLSLLQSPFIDAGGLAGPPGEEGGDDGGGELMLN